MVDHHENSQRQIARTFRVSRSFIVLLLQRWRQAGTQPALSPDGRRRLFALDRDQPDATKEPMHQRGGFRGRLKTLWRALQQKGLTRKKESVDADERQRPEVQ